MRYGKQGNNTAKDAATVLKTDGYPVHRYCFS